MDTGDRLRAAGPTDTVAAAPPARAKAKARGRRWELNLLGRVWSLFASVRLALVLILILTAAVLAGTVLMQAPPSVAADPAAYEQWLEGARGKYGNWTDVFDALGLFGVFHSFWFRLLVGLLTVQIIVCSLNRWKAIWATVFPRRVGMGDDFFNHARFNARMVAAMPAPAAAERVKRALARSRYRVENRADGDSIAIYADRNRFSRFGTLFSHLSIVLILVGTVVGGLWGFSDPGFVVAEGATREVGMGTDLSVGLEHFIDEYYLDGSPKDFRSEVVIYKGGEEVKRGTVRVNAPLNYEGVRFHQSAYGQAAVMEVREEDGTVLFSEGVPLAWRADDGVRPSGGFILPGRDLVVYVIGPVSGWNDPLISAGEMRVEVYERDTGTLVASENLVQGTATELAGLDMTFERERRFTVLKVVKDPGVNIIWAASGLMVFGLAMLFYFPHRRLWALCRPRPNGTAEVRLGTTAQRDLSLAGEFDRLRDRVRSALGIARESDDAAEGDGDV